MIAKVCGLAKKYPSFELSDISFELAGGRITGFIGRNGAGKTTTIKSMLNLIHPDGGEISFFGLPLTDQNIASVRVTDLYNFTLFSNIFYILD